MQRILIQQRIAKRWRRSSCRNTKTNIIMMFIIVMFIIMTIIIIMHIVIVFMIMFLQVRYDVIVAADARRRTS